MATSQKPSKTGSRKSRYGLSESKKMQDLHYLDLPDSIRGELSSSIAKHDDLTKLSTKLNEHQDTIRRWLAEAKILATLTRSISASRKGKYLRVSDELKTEILELTTVTSVDVVCEALSISRSTVHSWRRKISTSESKTTSGSSAAKENQDDCSAEAVVDEVAIDITANDTATQLKRVLARHEGKIRRVYSKSEKKQLMELVDVFGSKAVRDHFGISFDTIARWKRRRGQDFERKRTTPLRYIPVVELMRKHPGMGPMQIRDYLRRHKGLCMGVASIRRVMEENGWVPPYARISKLPSTADRYEAVRKNYLWHTDFKHQWINNFKAYFMFIQDDYSRFIVDYTIVDGEKVDAVIDCMNRAISLQGRPEAIMSDGGSAFRSWRGVGQFTRFLEDYSIEQIIAKTPNVNGKIENLHSQLEKEVLIPTQFSSLQHCADEVAKWVGFYNYLRVHQGLGHNLVPADRYCPGAKNWFQRQSDQGNHDDLFSALQIIARKLATENDEKKD